MAVPILATPVPAAANMPDPRRTEVRIVLLHLRHRSGVQEGEERASPISPSENMVILGMRRTGRQKFGTGRGIRPWRMELPQRKKMPGWLQSG